MGISDCFHIIYVIFLNVLTVSYLFYLVAGLLGTHHKWWGYKVFPIIQLIELIYHRYFSFSVAIFKLDWNSWPTNKYFYLYASFALALVGLWIETTVYRLSAMLLTDTKYFSE